MAYEIDTSMYPKVINPQERMAQVMSLANASQQNKLLQNEVKGQQGLSAAYNDPTMLDANGNFDTNKLLQKATNGSMGVAAPQAIAQAQSISTQAQQLSQEKIKTAIATNDVALSGLSSIINDPATMNDPDKLQKALLRVGADTYKATNGESDPPQVYLTHAMDIIKDPRGPQVALQQKIAETALKKGNLDNYLKMNYGTPISLHTGGSTITGTQNPMTGQITQNGSIADTLPATTTVKDPTTGASRYVGGVAGQQGNTGNTPPTPGSGQANPPASPAMQSQMPPPQGNAAPNPAPVQNGGPLAALGPGQETMLGNSGASAQKRIDDTIASASDARTRQDVNAQIVNLAGELGSSVGPVSTGVTSMLGKLADAPGIGPILKEISDKDPTDTAGQLSELKKYLLRSAAARGKAMGVSGTDYQTGLNVDANPNDKQFPQVIQKLAKYNLALDMLDQGKADAMQRFPGATTDPVANQQFEQQMRDATNINVYRAMLASPTERKDMFSQMSDKEKTQMIQDRRKLMALGAIPDQISNATQSQAAPVAAPAQ